MAGWRASNLRSVRLVVLQWLTLATCSAASVPTTLDSHVYIVEVTGERFRIALACEDQVEAADSLLSSGARVTIFGQLAHGNGGFDAPYRWHRRPESVAFPEATVEVCSGRPLSDVESDPSFWIDQLGDFCPWGVQMVANVGR